LVACTPRIADCGGLMIGVDSIEPNTPPLVIEKVPPVQVLQAELAVAGAFLPKSAICFSICAKLSWSASRSDRHHQAARASPPRRRCRSSRDTRCRCRRPRR
jgi:hypothetical protein